MKNIEILHADNENLLHRHLKIRNDVFITEKGVPISIEIDEYDCICEKCSHYLVTVDGVDAAAFRCLDIGGGIIKLQRFCVCKNFRNSGVGSAAIEYIEKFYRRAGMKKIVMDAKFEASGFYEKCGYKKVSAVFMEADVEHIKMEKVLQT